jgi:hypothetical protein
VWSPFYVVKAMVPIALCVTVVAARRHVLASDPRVERVVGPSNLAIFHNFHPMQKKLTMFRSV